MTARRQFGAAIVACVAGAGLVLLALRQGWARVDYTAPKPLPSGSIPVSGQDLLPAVSALALAALACMAAVIATRGVARRVVGVVMAGLGVWIAVLVSEPVHEATVLAAASGQAAAGGFAGSLPGGNSAISGGCAVRRRAAGHRPGQPGGAVQRAIAGSSAGRRAGGDRRGPGRGLARAALGGDVGPVRPARPVGARGRRPGPIRPLRPSRPPGPLPADPGPFPARVPRYPRPSPPPPPGPPLAAPPGPPAPVSPECRPRAPGPRSRSQDVPASEPGPADPGRADTRTRAPRPDDDAAALWEALDRGVDLTDTADGGAKPVAAPAPAEES